MIELSGMHVFIFFVGLGLAVCGASLSTRCRHRRHTKLPEDIQ